MTTTESAQARDEVSFGKLIADQTREPLPPLRRVAKRKKLHSSCKVSKRIYDPASPSPPRRELRSCSRTLPQL
jgi:hypothetical protein